MFGSRDQPCRTPCLTQTVGVRCLVGLGGQDSIFPRKTSVSSGLSSGFKENTLNHLLGDVPKCPNAPEPEPMEGFGVSHP